MDAKVQEKQLGVTIVAHKSSRGTQIESWHTHRVVAHDTSNTACSRAMIHRNQSTHCNEYRSTGNAAGGNSCGSLLPRPRWAQGV